MPACAAVVAPAGGMTGVAGSGVAGMICTGPGPTRETLGPPG